MKKSAILLLIAFVCSCSSDDESVGPVGPIGPIEKRWAIVLSEDVKSDSKTVDKVEKFIFEDEHLVQHLIKQCYFEEEISHETNLSYSGNQVTVTGEHLTAIYTLNSEGYAGQCTYTSASQTRTYSFSYSTEGYLTGITEYIGGTEYSSILLTYDNGDMTSISSAINGIENKFIYEPGEASSKYHLPCLGLLEIHPLTFHIEALYAELLGKAPRHFTTRSFPPESNKEQTVYTYEFDANGNPTKMGCQTTYNGTTAGYYPNTRNISISFE